MKRKLIFLAAAALILGGVLLWQGCGSSGPAPLTNISQLPSFDVTKYDYASGTASKASSVLSGKQGAGKVGAIGGFTRAGCEAYTAELKMIQDGKKVDAFLCYIKAVTKVMGKDLSKDSWSYYDFQMPSHTGDYGPPPNVRCRLGIFGGVLKMDACVPTGDGSYHRDSQVSIGTTANGYTGTVVNNSYWTETHNGTPDTRNGHSRIDVNIVGESTQSFTDATFTGSHNDLSVHTPATDYWKNWAQFTANASTHSNSIKGANAYGSSVWGDGTAALNAKWGADKIGTAKFMTTGAYPVPTLEQCQQWIPPGGDTSGCVGKCWQCPRDGQGQCTEVAPVSGKCPMSNSGVESFAIVAGTPPAFTVTANTSSAFYNEVNAADVPDLSQLNTDFLDTFDCNDASLTWIPFDASGADITACVAMEQEDQGLWNLCQTQEDAARSAGKIKS